MKEAVLFGELLRATRKARKLGIAQLAERANTGAKHLGRIERGEKLPSFELIIALANAMEVSPSVFFEFENIQTDPKILKEQVQQLLEQQDVTRLRRAQRVLRAVLAL
jgi:transcriptional regulator with XRE-family HTH domain